MERIYLIYLIIEGLLLYFSLQLTRKNEIRLFEQFHLITVYENNTIGRSIRVLIGRVLLLISYGIYMVFSVFKVIDPLTAAHDAYYYQARFEEINENSSLLSFVFKEHHEFEIGFELFYWICKKISTDYHVFLAVLFTITFIIYVIFIKKLYTKSHSLFSICAIFLLLISQFNTMRMTISIGISLCMIILLRDEKWKAAVATAFIAVLFHLTAIILFPMIVVNYIVVNRTRVSFKKLRLLIIGGMIIAVSSIGILNRLLIGTSKEEYIGSSGSLAYGTYTIIFIIMILAARRYKDFSELAPINRTIISVLPVCLCCIPLQYSVQMIYRMTLFFNPLIIGSIPSILKVYSKRDRLEDWCVTIFMNFYVVFRIYSFFTEELQYVGIYSNSLLTWLK